MKNEKILRVKQYINARLRLLKGSARRFWLRRFGPQQRTSDFGAGSRPDTLMLRERTWQIEMSRSKAKRFLVKHKIALVATFAVLLVGFVTHYVLIGFASTVDFYPSSCLGNWENVQNALGQPDLLPGSPASAFTTLNSAVFGTSTAQMFCGNFSGDTDINTLTAKSFQGADLVLSWSFIFPQAIPTSTVIISDGGGSGGGDAINSSGTPASTTAMGIPVPATTASDTDVVSTNTVASSSDGTDADSDASSGPSAVLVPVPATTTADSAPSSSSPTDATTSVSADTAATDTTDTADTTDATDTISPPPPPPVAPPSDTDSNDSTAPQTSWLQRFIGIAYADSTSSLAISASATQFSDSSSTSSSTLLTVASSAAQGTLDEPMPAPIDINTSMFQNIILPSSTADEVLAIVYSTDGVTWQPLANIDASNWQQGRYPIPITSWQELQHLQIAFVGLGSSSSPQIFLDSAGVEVSYVDTPVGVTDITSSTDQEDDGVGTSSDSSWTPPSSDAIIQKPTISEGDVFEQGARQQCVVAPFSGVISPGGSANFALELFSGLTTSSTPKSLRASSSSSGPIVYQHAVYQTQIGSLPVGVSATITPGPASDVSSTQALHISVSADAPPGSYSVLVVYRERQDDASMRSAGCQMNVVVQ